MESRKEILLSYIKTNIAPILVDFIFGQDLEDAVILPANIDKKELNGHYEEMNYVPPKWLNELLNKKNNPLLVIDQIDIIPKEEQKKFIELLKYRKVSTFDLPNNCRIIVTANKINEEMINEEVFSLVARI
jgi:DNA-binding NtrC family response regulator